METTTYEVQADGSIIKTITTDFGSGNKDMQIRVMTAEDYQTEQNAIQAKIDTLTSQLDKNQATTIEIQTKLSPKKPI